MATDPGGRQGAGGVRVGWLLALTWLAALAVAYTVVRLPLTGVVVAAAGRAALDGLAVAGLAALGGALGALALPDLEPLSALERAAARALLGLAAISLGVLAVGLAELFPPGWLAWLLLAGLLVGLHKPLAAWWTDLRAGLSGALAGEPDAFTRWVRCGVVALLGLTLVLALAPPTKWDALTYHLAGPKLYLQAGRIVSIPENHYLGFPQLTEMLYLGLMIMARPQAAALLHGAFGGLALLLGLGLTERIGKPAAGWLAAAVLLVSDSFWGEFHWPYNDLALVAYTLAALVMVLAGADAPAGRRIRWLVLAGAFTGCMVSIKYTAAGYAIGLGVLAVWSARREGLGGMVRTGAVLAGTALVVFAPWLAKNAALDGNPTSPFFFGTAAYDALDQWYYLRPGTGWKVPRLLLVPVQGTVFGVEGATPFGASAGALLVGLLPLAAVGWRRRSQAERTLTARLAIFVALGYAWWMVGAATTAGLTQIRLLFPLFPAMALIGALGVEGLRGRITRLDLAAVRVVIGLMLALALLGAGLDVVRAAPLRVLTGIQTEDDYLTANLGTYYAAMQRVNALEGEAKVLFLWEPRGFYCDVDNDADELLDTWWHDRQLIDDPFQIADGWQGQGFTHVLIHEAGLRFLVEEDPHEPLTAGDVAALDALRGTALMPVWDELDSYTLYALREGDGG